ncbi:MAG: hypothetical protein IPN79_15915 [Saprospiraceae bacterium]|nr:hypothetical protein [Saprospiraceae bacterium]
MAYSNPLKDKLRQPSDLPPGFGFEEMEEGIRNKMKTPKKKKRRFFWIWFLPLFLAGSTLFWALNQHNDQPGFDFQKGKSGPTDKNINNKTNNSTDNKSDNNVPVVLIESKGKGIPSAGHNNSLLNAENKLFGNVDGQKKVVNKRNPEVSNDVVSAQSTNKEHGQNQHTFLQNSEDRLTENVFTPDFHSTNQIPDESITEVQPSSILETPVFLTGSLTEVSSLSQNTDFPKISVADNPLWKWNIEAGGGFLYWNLQKNQSGLVTQIDHNANVSINPMYGWVAECRINSVFKNKYVAKIGLSATSQFYAFSYDGIKTLESISQNPEVITIETDVLTGRVTEKYGITIQSESTTRRLRSLNRDFFLRIPVSVGYIYTKRNWSFFAGGGGSLTVFDRQYGKTLAFGDIVSYQDNHPLQKTVNWLWEAEGKVAYHLSPQWNVGLSIRYFNQPQNVIYSDQIASKSYGFYPMVLIGKTLR